MSYSVDANIDERDEVVRGLAGKIHNQIESEKRQPPTRGRDDELEG